MTAIHPDHIQTYLELGAYQHVCWHQAGDVRTVHFQRLVRIPEMEGGDGVSVTRRIKDVRLAHPYVALGTINAIRIACGDDVLLTGHVPWFDKKDLDAHIASMTAISGLEKRQAAKKVNPFDLDTRRLPRPQWSPKYRFLVAASHEAAVDRMLIMGNLLRG